MDPKKRLRDELSGAAVAKLFMEIGGLSLSEQRRNKARTDYERRNRTKLKDLERAVQQKKLDESRPPPKPFRLKEFENIPAKVSTRGPTRPAASSHEEADCKSAPDSAKNNAENMKPRAGIDFVERNAEQAKRTPRKPSNQLDRNIPKPTPPGEIPDYLLKRKEQWEHEERQRLAEERERRRLRAIPRDFIMLPEEERLETLAYLKLKRTTLIDELSRMPIIVETLAMKARRRRIEATLDELERAVDTFSRPVVFVPDPAAERENPESNDVFIQSTPRRPPPKTPAYQGTAAFKPGGGQRRPF